MVVFCSDSDNPGLAVVGKVVFVGLVLVNIWCSVGGAETVYCRLLTSDNDLQEYSGQPRIMSVATTLVW